MVFSKGDIKIYIGSGEGGKTPDDQTMAGESFIWVEGPKGELDESIDLDVKSLLEFLNLDPIDWDNAARKTQSYNRYLNPIVNIEPELFDWSTAMRTELEWLIEESIISGLTEEDLQQIVSKVEIGNVGYNNRLLYWNNTWVPFDETGGLLIRLDWESIESQLDLNDLPDSVPGVAGEDPKGFDITILIIGGTIIVFIAIGTFSYSRLKRKSILDNLNRKNIYENIKANPGIHYMALQRELDIPPGVLAYHLNVLEKKEYIKSMQDSKYRRFYLSGVKSDLKMALTSVQMRILNVVNKNPGISQSKISDAIGKNRMLVNYHIRILTDAGILTLEKRGRESQCYTTSATAYYVDE